MIEDVYNTLLRETKSARVKQTLKIINQVCEEQLERGSKDFSISTISRVGGKLGVPQAQSIRNKSGQPYKLLIKAWQEAYSPHTVTKSVKGREWVERIKEPTIRYLVYDLLSKNRHLYSELQLVKSVKTLEVDLRQKNSDLHSTEKLLSWTESEIDALSLAIDDSFIDRNRWVKTSRGAIINESGSIIFERGFVSAIQKILDLKFNTI
ncbi:gamma-mobile-trio protein GmtX [Paraglaciecola sp. L1A13]|uniref:gamma-mobile-trio protein GmtX n=1 Tax=Paraglaciecola sp. L1A13 TaxID=2686359 RepID=UPI00131DC38A|nr:gamma-mobile-trio protein GmtX [Paraglaciecola sp. L1A13]